MVNSVARAMRFGAGIALTAASAQAAFAAVPFTFNTTGPASATTEFKNASTTDNLYESATYTATSGTAALSMRVTGWQASTDGATISQSSIGLWSGLGIGVQSAGDTGGYYSGALYDHQIDNKNGIDFVMLQFDQLVTLTGVGRYAYGMASYPERSYSFASDADYWADTTNALGTSTTASPITAMSATAANSYKVQSNWTRLLGTSSASNQSTSTTVTSSKYAYTWLVGADYLVQGDDGFKLSAISVAAVPEPASWAMMIVGFGAVGGTMRRTRRTLAAA